MAEDYKKIAESIRSGKYFGDARGWFEAVYIGPVSERSFFLIIAILAGFVALFGFMSISRLMPLTKHDPIHVYAGERPDEVQMSLVPLAPHHAEVNPAITKFFLGHYVEMREGYDARTFTKNATFVQAQSSPDAYAEYAATYDPHNAQSPFAPLGDLGQRLVSIESIRFVKVKDAPAGQERAEVNFSTDTASVTDPTTTEWTATIDYIYTSLESTITKNPATKTLDLEVTDPHFQVVNYALQEQKQPTQ